MKLLSNLEHVELLNRMRNQNKFICLQNLNVYVKNVRYKQHFVYSIWALSYILVPTLFVCIHIDWNRYFEEDTNMLSSLETIINKLLMFLIFYWLGELFFFF